MLNIYKSRVLLAFSFFLIFSVFAVQAQEMFDDFSYSGPNDAEISKFSWIIRSGSGGPGPTGCTWSKNNISFVSETDGNTSMRMKSSTSGTAISTSQCEIYTPREYLAGTYAARIRFTNSPFTGITTGDQINQTFFAISPLNFSLDPAYSEVDFVEYLPNGGWGVSGSTYWMTTWETYQADPWIQQSKSSSISQNFEGWHIVSCVVYGGEVRYYLDGVLRATHNGIYYPESLMSINFNLWYIGNGLVSASSESRSYVEDVDWVYHAKDSVVDTQNLQGIVDNFRSQYILSKRLDGQIRVGSFPISYETESFEKRDITIFRDPLSDKLTLKIKGGKDALVRLYSVEGRMLYQGEISGEISTISIAGLALKGLVIANVSTKYSTYSLKVMLE